MSISPPADATGSPVSEPLTADSSAALLAELDALLERMLALPVNNADEPPDAPVQRTEVPPENVPVVQVTQTALSPADAPAPDDLYLQTIAAAGPVQPPEPPPVEPTRPPEPVFFRAEPTAPRGVEVPAESLPEARLPEQAARSRERPPAAWLKPLVWCNRLFDACVAPWGPPGRWLSRSAGRNLLGWTGLLLLAATAGLALCDYLGWTW
jgi:hypothetical protein